MIHKAVLLVLLSFFCLLGNLAGAAYRVGVIWENKSGMGDNYHKGLMDYLHQKQADILLETYQANGSDADFSKKLAIFEDTKDAIVVYRSAGLEKAKKYSRGKIPIIGGACSNPKALNVLDNPESPEGNITAVTYFINPADQLKVLHKIFPEVKKIGLLYEKGHPAGELVEVPQAFAAAKSLGITVLDRAIVRKEGDSGLPGEAKQLTHELVANGCEVIVITNTNSAYMSAKAIVEASGKVPVFSFNDKAITAGALGGLVANDEALGAMVGEDLLALKQGVPLVKIPVKFDHHPKFYLNETKMKELHIALPHALLTIAKILK